MAVEYRDETEFTNDLHTLQQIADALRHKKFGKDVREAIAQAVEKLYGIGPNTVISGSPAGAYATLSELQSAYPNGQQGVFVVAETGKWYIWNPRENRWDEGGNFQSPMSQNEIEDGRKWADGTVSPKIGDAIRGQVAQEKAGRVQADLQEKAERQLADQEEKRERQLADQEINSRIDIRDTALEIKPTYLIDAANNFLGDADGDRMRGGVFLPKTDLTGTQDGVPIDAGIVGYTFLGHLKEYGLPILKLESPDLPTLTKDDGKLHGVKFSYETNLQSHAGEKPTSLAGVLSTIKVQGATSAGFPKKNFTIHFDSDVCLKESWGYHSKYVIKADWVDFSQLRNEFGAYLWREIRKTRINGGYAKFIDSDEDSFVDSNGNTLSGETRVEFSMGLGLGAIDSYPILVVINGIYHGLYSLTIPKDDWMAAMGNGIQEAILSADAHSPATRMKSLASTDDDGNLSGTDYSIEYVTDEDDQGWVPSSLNSAIQSVIEASEIGEVSNFDIDSAIDYMILTYINNNTDGIDKNWLLDTWDGTNWYLNAYDMDGCFGNNWNGQDYLISDGGTLTGMTSNRLFDLIKQENTSLKSRWSSLRSSLLTDESVEMMIDNFAVKIPQAVLDYELKRWPSRPGTRTNTHEQIQRWTNQRLSNIDNLLL